MGILHFHGHLFGRWHPIGFAIEEIRLAMFFSFFLTLGRPRLHTGFSSRMPVISLVEIEAFKGDSLCDDCGLTRRRETAFARG
jgi:hypothetical protein